MSSGPQPGDDSPVFDYRSAGGAHPRHRIVGRDGDLLTGCWAATSWPCCPGIIIFGFVLALIATFVVAVILAILRFRAI